MSAQTRGLPDGARSGSWFQTEESLHARPCIHDPEELMFMLPVVGGMAIIVGARKAGSTLIATALALAVLPALLLPLFESLPGGLLSVLWGSLRWPLSSAVCAGSRRP